MCVDSLKQSKLIKLNHLKNGQRQTQQYSERDVESTREDQTIQKRQSPYAAGVRKGYSKTSLSMLMTTSVKLNNIITQISVRKYQ